MNILLDITKCVRCDQDHRAVAFTPFMRAPTQFTHWAMCPVTNEPMLVGSITEEGAKDLWTRARQDGRQVKLSVKKSPRTKKKKS